MNAPLSINLKAEAESDSARSYDLAIKAAREQCIRSGQIEPRRGDKTEERWAAEGPRKPSELDAARG